jgi:putative ABC transport system permease protein
VVVVLAAGGLVEELLFETSPREPVVLATVAGILILSGVVAALLPAWRATRVDPIKTLRTD